MTVVSHILSFIHVMQGELVCARCGVEIPQVQNYGEDRLKVSEGDRIGLISGLKFTEDAAYLIQKPEHDSNPMCPVKDSIP